MPAVLRENVPAEIISRRFSRKADLAENNNLLNLLNLPDLREIVLAEIISRRFCRKADFAENNNLLNQLNLPNLREIVPVLSKRALPQFDAISAVGNVGKSFAFGIMCWLLGENDPNRHCGRLLLV